MIARMRTTLAALLLACLGQSAAFGQCAPAPDSPYFFRNLSEQRAEAKIADDAAVFERLLSDTFQSRSADGKSLSKRDFIAGELAARPAKGSRRFYSIRHYTLVEHRKGYTVASYLLTEGMTGPGQTHLVESQLREVYEVIDGQWRLASVEMSPVAAGESLSQAR
jgi:hypothetical protein